MMPVEKLPAASWQTALGLGFVSAVFDNIPLTALALKQGGYDWGYPRLRGRFRRLDDLVRLQRRAWRCRTCIRRRKSVGNWLRHGWHVTLAYVVGFFVLYAVLGWQPHAPHKIRDPSAPVVAPRAERPQDAHFPEMRCTVALAAAFDPVACQAG